MDVLGNLFIGNLKPLSNIFFLVSIINSMCAVLCSVIMSKQFKMRKSLQINSRQDTISRIEVNSNVRNINKL